MSMGHTQKKRFIDKEIHQDSSCGSDAPSETYSPPLLSPIPKHLEIT